MGFREWLLKPITDRMDRAEQERREVIVKVAADARSRATTVANDLHTQSNAGPPIMPYLTHDPAPRWPDPQVHA